MRGIGVRRVGVFNVYRDVCDATYLRATIDALSGFVDQVAESEIEGDWVSLAGVALRRRKWAVERLTELLAGSGERCPVVLDPAEGVSVMSVQGQPVTAVVTAGAAGTTGLSSAQVWMPPEHVSRAHVHHHTDVGVVVLQGRAITLWWDRRGEVHELVQRAGQHLHIPFGVPHAAINPFSQPVVAVEWRSSRVFDADNERLPMLDRVVRERLADAKAAA